MKVGIVSSIRHGVKVRKAQRAARIAEQAAAEADAKFLSMHPEYIHRREAVEGYWNNYLSTLSTGSKKSEPSQRECFGLVGKRSPAWSNTPEDLIDSCHGNLGEMHTIGGSYLLAHYTHLPVERFVIPSGDKVAETAYREGDPVEIAITRYLRDNPNGLREDFSQRFGTVGETLMQHWARLGLINP